jgi:protoporphyrinogen oxidase
MSKQLDNDQRIRKGHRDVKDLGVMASTILAIELAHIFKQRLKAIKEDNNKTRVNPFVSNQATIEVLETFINPIIKNIY